MKKFYYNEITPRNQSHDESDEEAYCLENSSNGLYLISTEEAEFGSYYHSDDDTSEIGKEYHNLGDY